VTAVGEQVTRVRPGDLAAVGLPHCGRRRRLSRSTQSILL
jgi:hypothetical protein